MSSSRSGAGVKVQLMELGLLEKKIRRLTYRLEKRDIHLVLFEPKDIILRDQIFGRGGEGVVHKATVMYNDIPVDAAAKTVLNNSEDAISLTLDEIEMLCLAGDHIVNPTLQVYGVAAMPDENDPEMGHLVIVMEAGLMNALQLYQQEEIPPHVTYDFWSRLAAAVLCMHRKKIIHQDLKPENILVTGIDRDETGRMQKINFKIIDLGMAKHVLSEKVITDDILGTNGYHPPEVLFEDSYDFKADIFMLGVTFCVMLHTATFLQSTALKSLLRRLHQAKQKKLVGEELFENVLEPSFKQCQRDISPDIKNMICMMLEDQENREISLLGVLNICRLEAERAKQEQMPEPRVLRALKRCSNCENERCTKHTRAVLETKRANSAGSTAAPTAKPTARAGSYRLRTGVRRNQKVQACKRIRNIIMLEKD